VNEREWYGEPCGHMKPQSPAALHGICIFCWRDRGAARIAALKAERDALRERVADWEDSADNAERDHPDEEHCACVKPLQVRNRHLRERLAAAVEAMRDAVAQVGGSRMVSIGSLRNTHSAHIGVETVSRWRAAIAAAEGRGEGK